MTSKEPLVTVLMPCYNGQDFVAEAVKSIIGQSFTNWELLVIDDGSTDGSVMEIENLHDRRVKVVKRLHYGLVASLNYGLDHCRGKYVARMDADDICLPTRLEKQVTFMEKNLEVDVCGSWFETLGEEIKRRKTYMVDDKAIRCELLFGCPFAHPTVIMRRSKIEEAGLRYDPKFEHGEDYDFWVRAAKICTLANLPVVLLLHRMHPLIKSKVYSQELDLAVREIQEKQLVDFGVSFSLKDMDLHLAIGSYNSGMTANFLFKVGRWLLRLYDHNRKSGYYPRPEFEKVLASHLFSAASRLEFL